MLTQEQKELRRQGLGGSDLAAVLGLSPWRSPMVSMSRLAGCASLPKRAG